ncbi:hypothetical protein G9A89_010544 [Geosiphon pyriformis]|nr:hypothetical protein G9A89_010544 [Geosiphon pyriformis]
MFDFSQNNQANKPSFGSGFSFGGNNTTGVTTSQTSAAPGNILGGQTGGFASNSTPASQLSTGFGGGTSNQGNTATIQQSSLFGGGTAAGSNQGFGNPATISNSNVFGGVAFGGGSNTSATTSAFGVPSNFTLTPPKPTSTITPVSFGLQSKPVTQTSTTLFGQPSSTATTFPSTGLSFQTAFNVPNNSTNIVNASGLATYNEINLNLITMETKFHQLPESTRKKLVEMAIEIERQKEVMVSIDTMWPDVRNAIQSATNEARKVAQHINSLNDKLDASRRLVSDLEHTIVKQKIYHDNIKDASGSSSDVVFQKYLRDTITSMEERVEQYDQNVEELDRHISAVINATRGEITPNAISETMRLQHESFMIVTGKVASLHEMVEKLRKDYLDYLRLTGDRSNPFEREKSGKDGTLVLMEDEQLPLSYVANHALTSSQQQIPQNINNMRMSFNPNTISFC